jgi:RNA polymerase sigma-70 factor (ECF subfamily)
MTAPPAVRLSPAVERRLYERSRAAAWELTPEAFSARLRICVSKRLVGASAASERDADTLAEALHVEDLALACACAEGHGGAWEHFIRELRPPLLAAARQMTSSGPEALADSLFAELYGLEERDGRRRSLLDYYHGRAKLSTWLRTVLAQRHVDALRVSARTLSIDDNEQHAGEPSDPTPPVEPGRARYIELVQQSLDAALSALEAQDRLRLRLYYGEGLKLAQVGRILGEHEATVSRKIDRARREIRRLTEQQLRERHGLSAEQVRECLEHAASAPELDASSVLAGDS